jgi:hypothetical protein
VGRSQRRRDSALRVAHGGHLRRPQRRECLGIEKQRHPSLNDASA